MTPEIRCSSRVSPSSSRAARTKSLGWAGRSHCPGPVLLRRPSASLHSGVGVVGRVRASLPKPEFLSSCSFRKSFKQTRVSTPSTFVEVRGRSTNGDQPDVHIQCAVHTHDVTQEPSVLIDPVGRRLREQPHSRPDRKQRLCRARGCTSVALHAEIHLRRVYLNEPDPLSVSQRARPYPRSDCRGGPSRP